MLTKVITTEQIDDTANSCGLIELRLDYWQKIEIPQVANFIAGANVPVMLTLRPISEGGRFQGSETARINLLQQLIALSPAYLDIENTLENSVIAQLKALNPLVKLIRSYHNFKETPLDLSAVLAEMQHPDVHIYKIATQANSTLDALRMLQFVQSQQQQTIVGLCMGEYGSCTRILAPVVGSCWTYVPSQDQDAVAPGMLTMNELINIYHYPKLNRQTKIFALIGDPVVQSEGHYFHNAYYNDHNLNAVYVKFKLAKNELAEFFQRIKLLPIAGISVTMPLKESVLPFVDHCDEIAERVNAVNTLKIINGEIYATNTDVIGVLQPILEAFDMTKTRNIRRFEYGLEQLALRDKKALVIGAGGAAKAVIYALQSAGAAVSIINRSEDKSQLLARQFGIRVQPYDIKENFDLVVNTLPDVPLVRDFISPIVDNVVSSATLAMDIIYKPKETAFIQCAQRFTTKIIYGEKMFIAQAEAQAKYFKQLDIQI